MAVLLVVSPRADKVETSLGVWADRLLAAFAEAPHEFQHVEVSSLLGPGLTREQVRKEIDGAGTLVYYGHGARDALGTPVLVDGDDAARMLDGVVVAFACDAGSAMAHVATAGGLGCFVGFSNLFMTVIDEADAPWSEWMEAAVSGVLMTHGTAGDVHRALRDRFSWIVQVFANGARAGNPNAPLHLMAAFWNREHLTVVGNRMCAV